MCKCVIKFEYLIENGLGRTVFCCLAFSIDELVNGSDRKRIKIERRGERDAVSTMY